MRESPPLGNSDSFNVHPYFNKETKLFEKSITVEEIAKATNTRPKFIKNFNPSEFKNSLNK